MNILYLNRESGFDYIALVNQLGNSDAIALPKEFRELNVVISDISGGSVKVQWSLSDRAAVDGDVAIWHDWTHQDVLDFSQHTFDMPIRYLRVLANDEVEYTFEILS